MPVISTNTAANTSLRYLNENSDMQSGSLAKISSGKRIERASDDAAGLAVSTSLRSDISVLEQAAINADQGISVLQTADGALARMDDILQRMSSLAGQSINGGVDDATREFIDAEFQQLIEELDDIATSTNFNGGALLNGSYDEEFLLGTDGSVAAASTNRLSIEIADYRTSQLQGYAEVASDDVNTNDFDYTNGNQQIADVQGAAYTPADFSFVLGTDTNGDGNITVLDEDFVQVDIDVSAGTYTYREYDGSTTGSTRTVTDADQILTATSTVNDVLDAINASGVVTAGVNSSGELVINGAEPGKSLGFTGLDAFDADFAADTAGIVAGGATTSIAIAAATDPAAIADANADGTTGDFISVDTIDNAEIASNVVSGAIFQVAQARAEIGAQISRFEFRADVIDSSVENLTAANSAILDADIASEQTNFTNYATLTEAAIAGLAAANELPSELLRLLQ
jgi:flagellin